MALSHMTDTQTTTTTGIKSPATLAKFPEGGATFTVGLTTGSATIELWAWNSSSYKHLLATFTLSGATLKDALPVFSIWEDWEWNVTAIAGGGTLTLDACGLGV